MKKKLVSILLITMLAISITACGKKDDGYNYTEENAYLSECEDGIVYVRHEDNSLEPVYLGYTTFENGSYEESTDDSRVAWFTDEDLKNVPTLQSGESLIMYSKNVLDENFTFERFEDYGYTVGICGLTETDSGRYLISTEGDAKTVYPYCDAEELLSMDNESVILDEIGGIKLRASDNEEDIETTITRGGTINGLTKDDTYVAKFYAGTVEYDYLLCANIRAMISMEGITDTDYNFEQNYIINIKIPEQFHSGYYVVNGQGMFRYIASEDVGKDIDSIDFNIANNIDSEELNNNAADSNLENKQYEVFSSMQSAGSDCFTLDKKGKVTVNVGFEILGDKVGDGLPEVEGVCYSPSGDSYEMAWDEELQILYLTFDAKEVGEYTIEFFNLYDRAAQIYYQYN